MRTSPTSLFLLFVGIMGVMTMIRMTKTNSPRRVSVTGNGINDSSYHSTKHQKESMEQRRTIHQQNHDGQLMTQSDMDYEMDKKLNLRYSTTEHNIPGNVSFMFDGSSVALGPPSFTQLMKYQTTTTTTATTTPTTSETDGRPSPTLAHDFQHKGIVKIGCENKKKWIRLKETPADVKYKIDEKYHGWVEDDRLVVQVNDPTMLWSSVAKKVLKLTRNSTDDDDGNGGNNDGHDNMEDGHENKEENKNTIKLVTKTTSSLCQLLSQMTIRTNLDKEATDERGLLPAFLNMTVDCTQLVTATKDQTSKKQLEEGWLVASLYIARMVAAKARVDFQFMCQSPATSNEEHKLRTIQDQHVFVWLGGYQSSPSPTNPWPYGGDKDEPPKESRICQAPARFETVPLHRMAYQIRSDVRRMVVTLVGSDPRTGRTHPLVPLDATPLISSTNDDVLFDDMVVYVPPCKDVVAQSPSSTAAITTSTGEWMKHFKRYMDELVQDKHTINSIKSIGIVWYDDQIYDGLSNTVATKTTTTPKQRKENRCVEFGNDLQNYIRKKLENQNIMISMRNDDTMPITYSRLVLARYLFIPSNNLLSLFASIGSFGEVFLLPQTSTTSKTARWIEKIPSMKGFDNFHLWTHRHGKESNVRR